MRYIIIIALIIGVVFAQSMNWWVADQSGGMQVFGSNDTIWVSTGQAGIGQSNAGGVYLGAGYLYSGNDALKLIEKDQKPYSIGINSITPNPFNTLCSIDFEIEKEGLTELTIYDIMGWQVDRPVSEQLQPGKYRLTWNGGTNPSGTYFFRLQSGDKSVSKRFVYLK